MKKLSRTSSILYQRCFVLIGKYCRKLFICDIFIWTLVDIVNFIHFFSRIEFFIYLIRPQIESCVKSILNLVCCYLALLVQLIGTSQFIDRHFTDVILKGSDLSRNYHDVWNVQLLGLGVAYLKATDSP